MATNDHGSYAGKVAFVTGAASDIGTPERRAAVIAQEPIGRMGTPEEIAAAVPWLCSDAASFVVGHAMVADGAKEAHSASRRGVPGRRGR